MGASPLDHVLRHNSWATGALIEFCRTLDAPKLEAAAIGTYGTINGTLQHLVGAEQWYVKLLTGRVLGNPIRRSERHTLDELSVIAAATGPLLVELAASDDPTRVIETNHPDERSTAGVIIAQVVHHGNEHRTQVTTILGANGMEPPALSAWAYGRAMRISTNGE